MIVKDDIDCLNEMLEFYKGSKQAEEIRLCRELVKSLEKVKWSLDQDSYWTYRALLDLYEQQETEETE